MLSFGRSMRDYGDEKSWSIQSVISPRPSLHAINVFDDGGIWIEIGESRMLCRPNKAKTIQAFFSLFVEYMKQTRKDD